MKHQPQYAVILDDLRRLRETAQTDLFAHGFGEYIRAIARAGLTRFSVGNQALLLWQAADQSIQLTDVDTYRGWLRRGRIVRTDTEPLRLIVSRAHPVDADRAHEADVSHAYVNGHLRPVRYCVGPARRWDISQTDPYRADVDHTSPRRQPLVGPRELLDGPRELRDLLDQYLAREGGWTVAWSFGRSVMPTSRRAIYDDGDQLTNPRGALTLNLDPEDAAVGVGYLAHHAAHVALDDDPCDLAHQRVATRGTGEYDARIAAWALLRSLGYPPVQMYGPCYPDGRLDRDHVPPRPLDSARRISTAVHTLQQALVPAMRTETAEDNGGYDETA